MALPTYTDVASSPEFKALPEEKKLKLTEQYWNDYEQENPGDKDYVGQQREVSQKYLTSKAQLQDAAPLARRLLEPQHEDTKFTLIAAEGLKTGKLSPEEFNTELEARKAQRAATQESLKKTVSLFDPKVDEQMQPAWKALETTALSSGYFEGKQALRGPDGELVYGDTTDVNRAKYTQYRDTLAKDFNLQPEEVDDLVKHRMGLQKDAISRDVLGQLHIKDELLVRGNDDLQKAIIESELPDKVKSDLSIEAPIRLAKFKAGVVENVKQKHPELAADIKWTGDVQKDYAALTEKLNTGAAEQLGGGAAAYGLKRAAQFSGREFTEPGELPPASPQMPQDIQADMAGATKKQESVNQLSNFINQEKVRVLGVDAATIGAGMASGAESIVLGAMTGGLGSTLISADRIAKAGTAGKVLLGGLQRGLNTAPIAAIYGTEQGLETYERTGDVKLSLLSAAIEGGVTTAFGAVKLGGTEDVGQRIATAAARRELGKSVAKSWGMFALGLGKTVAEEIPEELAITALNDLYVESKLNPGMTVDDLKKNLYDTLVTTVAASAPAGALGSAAEQGTNLLKSTTAQTTDELHDTADELYKTAAKENLPEAEAAGGTVTPPSSEGVAPVIQMTRQELEEAVAEDAPEDVGRPLEEIAAERGVEIIQDNEQDQQAGADTPQVQLPPVPTGETAPVSAVETGSAQEGTGTAETKAEGEVAAVIPEDKGVPQARAVVSNLLTPEAKTLPPENFQQQKAASPEQVTLQNSVAKMYDALPEDDSSNPEVIQAYTNLVSEVSDQYKSITDTGLKFELVDESPYKSSKEMIEDVKNGRLKVQRTDASTYGSNPEAFTAGKHPMLADSGQLDINGQPMLVNDVFRGVHDYIAHAAFGSTFGPLGEEAAWKAHLATIKDPLARRALTTETRGQNSWVNYRDEMLRNGAPIKKGEPGYVAPQDRPFATQKFALLPEAAMQEITTTNENKVQETSGPATQQGVPPVTPAEVKAEVGTPQRESQNQEKIAELAAGPATPENVFELLSVMAGVKAKPATPTAPTTPKLVQGQLFQTPESQGDPAAIKLVQSYKGSPPKGATRALIDYAGEPLLAQGDLGDLPAHTVRDIKEADQIIQQNTGKNGKAKLGRVGFNKFLSQLWKRHHRGKSPGWHNFQSRRDIREMGKILSFEVAHALSKDKSGVDWYRSKISSMYDTMGQLYPELREDSEVRFLFSVMLAVTSNGQTVVENLRDTAALYEQMRGKSRLPVQAKTSRSERNAAVQKAFREINSLLDENSWQDVKKELLAPHTVSELKKKFGLAITGELADHNVIGAMILGPKIGSFWGNLNEHYDSITMDLWFTRTMNRLSGDTATMDSSKFASDMRSLLSYDLPVDVKNDIKKYLADAETGDKSWVKVPSDIRESLEHFYDFAKKTYSQYASSGFTDRSDFNKNIQKLVKELDGGEDTPDNGTHRKWMRDVVGAAQEDLKKHGVNITNADLQAILWFHEKDLYTRFGATSQRGERTDYAQAARRVADEGRAATGRITGDAGQSAPAKADSARQLTLFQQEQGPKGTYTYAQGAAEAQVAFLETADATTGAHEWWHAMREGDFFGILTPEEITTLEAWETEGTGVRDTKAIEKGARGWERFLFEGTSTGNASVDAALTKLAEWMRAIYKQIQGSSINIDISPEVRAIMEKLLTRGVQGAPVVSVPVKVVAKPAPKPQAKVKQKLPPKRPVSTTTSVKNAATDRYLAENGMAPILGPARKANEEAMDEASARVAKDDKAGTNVVNGILASERSVNDEVEEGVLMIELATRKARVARYRNAVNDAFGNEDAVREAQRNLQEAQSELLKVIIAAKLAGTAWGRIGQLRQRAINEDFSLEAMEARFAAEINGGAPLTADQSRMIAELQKKIAAAEARTAEVEAEIAIKEREVQALLKKMEEKANAKPRKAPERRGLTERTVAKLPSARDLLSKLGYGKKVLEQREESDLGEERHHTTEDKLMPYPAIFRPAFTEVFRDTGRGFFSSGEYSTSDISYETTNGGRTLESPDVLRKELSDYVNRFVDSYGDTVYSGLAERWGVTEDQLRKYLGAEPQTLRQDPEESLPPEALEAFGTIAAAYILEGKSDTEVIQALNAEFGVVAVDNDAAILEAAREQLNKTAAGSRAKTPTELFNLLEPDKDISNKLVFNMVRGMISEGVPKEKVLKKVLKLLQEKFPALTYDELSDIFTGYGKVKFPSQEEDLKAVRELRNIERIQRQIRELEAGNIPKKTGQQRDAATLRIRELQKELKEAFRAAGIKHTTSATQLKGALDAIKTRLKNELEDIDKAIRTNTPISRKKTQIEYDQEIKDLQARRDARRKDYDKLFGVNRKAMSDSQRLKATIKALNKRIAEERALAQKGLVDRINNSAKPVTNAEVEALKATLTALVEARSKARAALYPSISEEQRAMNRAESVSKRLIEYYRKVLAGTAPGKSTPVKFTPGAELAKLIALKDDLKAAVKEMRKQQRFALRLSKEERSRRAAIKALERSVADLEARVARGDLSPRTRAAKRTDLPSELVKRQEAAQAALKALQEATLPSKEERRENALVRASKTRREKIEARIAAKDYVKVERVPAVMSTKLAAARLAESKAKEEWNRGFFEKQLADRTFGKKTYDTFAEVLNFSRTMKTIADVSAVLRQGLVTAISHPVLSSKAIPNMFLAGFSEVQHQRIKDQIENHTLFALSQQAKLFIADTGLGNEGSLSKIEEAFRGRWAKKVPGISSVVGFSERTYNAYLNQVRIAHFANMVNGFTGGKPTVKEAKIIAHFVNIATGRGDLKNFESAAAGLAAAFFSPKFVVSRFQVLWGVVPATFNVATGFQLVPKDVRRAKIATAKEYARLITGIASVYGLAVLAKAGFGDDDDPAWELDPRSSSFGRIRIGNTSIDPMGGLLQAATFAARMLPTPNNGVWRPYTKTGSGDVVSLWRPGFGKQSYVGVMGMFLRTKLSPVPASVINMAQGEDVIGGNVTWQSEAIGSVVPLVFGDIYDTFKENGVKGTPLAVAVMFGLGVQTRNEEIELEQYLSTLTGVSPQEYERKKASDSRGDKLQLKLNLDLKLKP